MRMNEFLIINFVVFSISFLINFTNAEEVGLLSNERCQLMKDVGVIDIDAPVQCERLRIVTFSYTTFDKSIRNDGEIIVFDVVAEYVKNVFNELNQNGFPIQSAKSITHFEGDDDKSMSANNTSAFNYRVITGGGDLSLHAYGLAIDLNPHQNPFVKLLGDGITLIKPIEGEDYLNRMKHRLNKKSREGFAEDVISVFSKNGFFYWGGYWDTPIDYQHFQVSRELAQLLSSISYKDGLVLFDNHVKWFNKCNAISNPPFYFKNYLKILKSQLDQKDLIQVYMDNPQAIREAMAQELPLISQCYVKKQ